MSKKKDELKPSGGFIKSAYPNPFNSEVAIEYELSSSSPDISAELTIYNISGQKVRTLLSEKKTPGTYSVKWDGMDNEGIAVSTGIYMARLQAQNMMSIKKILLVK